MAAARSPPESVPERGEYRVVFAPSVAVRDAPWGQKVGTKAQGDVVRTDMRSVGDDRKGGGWVRLEGGYEGGEGWMLLHGAALGLGSLLEAAEPAEPAEPAGTSSAAPALIFLCTGEGEHSADTDVAYLRASPSWLDVQATVAELTSVSPLEIFFDQTLGEHGHQYSPLVTAAICILNADLWRSWGFRPALALGHSIGEVSAAYVAGVLTRDEALRTAFQLGRAGSELEGGMLATVLPADHAILSRNGADPQALCVAALNYEERVDGAVLASVTLSGPTAHVKAWLVHDERAKALRVERPWHHPAYESTAAMAMVTMAMVSPAALHPAAPASAAAPPASRCSEQARGSSTGGALGAHHGAQRADRAVRDSTPSPALEEQIISPPALEEQRAARCTFVSATTATALSHLEPGHWATWLTRPVQFYPALCCAAALLHRRGGDNQPPTVVTVELGCHPTLTSYTSKVLTREGVQVLAQGAAMRRGHATAGFITRERTRLEALLKTESPTNGTHHT